MYLELHITLVLYNKCLQSPPWSTWRAVSVTHPLCWSHLLSVQCKRHHQHCGCSITHTVVRLKDLLAELQKWKFLSPAHHNVSVMWCGVASEFWTSCPSGSTLWMTADIEQVEAGLVGDEEGRVNSRVSYSGHTSPFVSIWQMPRTLSVKMPSE